MTSHGIFMLSIKSTDIKPSPWGEGAETHSKRMRGKSFNQSFNKTD